MNPNSEWLETDGQGGYASGTTSGLRTRRYHGLLVAAQPHTTDRILLVNGFDVSVQTGSGHYFLNSQWYAPGVIDHESQHRIESFRHEPWPQWIYEIEDGTRIEHQILFHREKKALCLSWRLLTSTTTARLFLRPFISGRSYHSLHEENTTICLDAATSGKLVQWRPYPALPTISSLSNGQYVHEPLWYRHFLYKQELERGLDAREDLASPGLYSFDLTQSNAQWLVSTKNLESLGNLNEKTFNELVEGERKRRQKLSTRLRKSADQYIVTFNSRATIIAGYPWFTDWGRHTFISLRGLCLSTGRLAEAHSIISSWCEHLSEGMLPNYFPEQKDAPEYDSVAASLWLIIAIYELLQRSERENGELFNKSKDFYHEIIEQILSAYAQGTRFSIGMDTDGLLKCGERGTALTWMNARVEENPVTPRVGKPVEVQALWLNALKIASIYTDRWDPILQRAAESFSNRFWNSEKQCLFDVIDCFHIENAKDDSVRPNQIFAVGGLPFSFLDQEKSELIVETVEKLLLTPFGLRTLSPEHPHYRGTYSGNVSERDQAYHQGTVWLWLMGPFVEAWISIRKSSALSKVDAKNRFITPLMDYLNTDGLGHLPELTDAEPPFKAKGCPFDACSISELIRLNEVLSREASSS